MLIGIRLLGLEEEDGAVPKVEVDEVFGFVGDKGSEVAADDAMPCRSLALIKLSKLVRSLAVWWVDIRSS